MKAFQLSLFILIINLFSCQESKVYKSDNSKEIVRHTLADTINDKVENTAKKESLNVGNQITEIDTFKIISQIECQEWIGRKPNLINIDSIEKYKLELSKLDKEAQKILNASNCYRKFKATKNYLSFLVLTESESHYSSIVKLVTISRIDKKVSQLELAYKYGNELEDKFVESIIENDSIITRQTESIFRYIHGIGKVDSSNVKKSYYKLLDNGKLIETD